MLRFIHDLGRVVFTIHCAPGHIQVHLTPPKNHNLIMAINKCMLMINYDEC